MASYQPAALRVTWLPLAIVGTAVLVALALIASRATHTPLFDGGIYADCIVNAAELKLAVGALRCADHISHAYMLFAGAIQMLSPGSYPLILLANGLLYVLACAGVYRLASLGFPDVEHALERGILTAAFAVHPALLAAVVQPNIDLPMLPAFLWGTVFAIRRQRLALILAGMALVTTKESGVLLYGSLVLTYAVGIVLQRRASPRSLIRTLVGLTPLALPLVVFGAYIVYRMSVPQYAVIWNTGNTDTSTTIARQFVVPRVDRFLFNYLVMILVMSFAWIGTGIIGLDAATGAVRALRKRAPRPLPGADGSTIRLLVILWIVLVFTLTRFSTFSNTRYFLPIFALTPFLVYASLVRFSVPAIARRSLLGVVGALWLVSTVRTVDPVSRRWFGTLEFGDHRILRMTSRTSECCAYGRDQLAYNLQFTVLSALVSDATSTLVGDSLPVFVPLRTDWYNVNPLDSTTFRRTLRRNHRLFVTIHEQDDLRTLPQLPARAVFIAMPIGEIDAASHALERRYVISEPRRFRRGGYWLDAHHLTLRDSLP